MNVNNIRTPFNGFVFISKQCCNWRSYVQSIFTPHFRWQCAQRYLYSTQSLPSELELEYQIHYYSSTATLIMKSQTSLWSPLGLLYFSPVTHRRLSYRRCSHRRLSYKRLPYKKLACRMLPYRRLCPGRVSLSYRILSMGGYPTDVYPISRLYSEHYPGRLRPRYPHDIVARGGHPLEQSSSSKSAQVSLTLNVRQHLHPLDAEA